MLRCRVSLLVQGHGTSEGPSWVLEPVFASLAVKLSILLHSILMPSASVLVPLCAPSLHPFAPRTSIEGKTIVQGRLKTPLSLLARVFAFLEEALISF